MSSFTFTSNSNHGGDEGMCGHDFKGDSHLFLYVVTRKFGVEMLVKFVVTWKRFAIVCALNVVRNRHEMH
jgi:hypothetical protein